MALGKEIGKYFDGLMKEEHFMRVSDSSYVYFLLEQLPMDWSMIREKLVGAIHGSENDKEIELEKERLR